MKVSSYIENILSRDEKVLYQAKVSFWSLLPLLIVGLLLISFIIGILFWIIALIRYTTTELAVTNKKIIAKTGFIKRNTIEMLLHRVESIQVHQSVLGRLLNYGTVIVSGAGNPQAPIPGISFPLDFRKRCMEIQEQIENETDRTKNPSTHDKYATEELEIDIDIPATSEPTPAEKSAKWKAKGRDLVKNGNFREAIAALTNAINAVSDDSNAYYLRAVAFSKLKDDIKMVADLEEAASLGNSKAEETLEKIRKNTK